jgi:threonine dehydratase
MADVLAARQRIAPYLRPTALYRYPALDAMTGTQTWVKHENHQPVGAFKVRGGVNLVSQLTADERRRGVITASTGNHGQSVAYAADLFGVQAVVCMPEQANPVKVESMRALGAQVVFHGRDFDEAREYCEKQATEQGFRYIHSGNEPMLIAGVATCTLEILQTRPDIEVIVVPVGGGSGAAGACLVAKSVRPSIEVIGVQSEAAPAAYRSWQARSLLEDTTATVAEGLATRTAFELPQRILWQLLDDFVLVTEEALTSATRLMIEKTRNLVEPAAAAALAAVLDAPDRFAGRRVALVCSGGNISPAQLVDLWPAGLRVGGQQCGEDTGEAREVVRREVSHWAWRVTEDSFGYPGLLRPGGRDRYNLRAAVTGADGAGHQSAAFEIIHHDRGVGLVGSQGGRQLAHGNGSGGDAPQRLGADEAHAERIADLLAAVVTVGHQRPHGLPGLGGQLVGSQRGSRRGHGTCTSSAWSLRTGGCPPADSRSSAVRAAVRRAHRPVVTTPRTRMIAPQAATIHQPGSLAGTNPVRRAPCRLSLSTEPMTATPSELPTCRLVEATPAATPACCLGIPDTAALVIGAFTRPNPTPNTM